MKIIITGLTSYIGNALKNYLSLKTEHDVKIISLRENLNNYNFSDCDVIFHAAGIAHDNAKKIRGSQKNLYYAINTDLTEKLALKAKSEHVKQFIFMSSAIIYGKSSPIGKNKIITRETLPSPESDYAESKLQAEKKLLALEDLSSFKICIIRSPMVYGKNSKSNYKLLSRLARITPVFPKINNVRSMIYIENLTEFIRLMIDNNERGIFFPQNSEWISTPEIIQTIAQVHGRKIILLPAMEVPLKILSLFTPLINKAFGSLAYEKSLSAYKFNYQLFNFHDSITKSEEP